MVGFCYVIGADGDEGRGPAIADPFRKKWSELSGVTLFERNEAGCTFLLASLGTDSPIAENDRYAIAVGGEVYERKAPPADSTLAERMLYRVEAEGPEALYDLDGAYTIALYDKQTRFLRAVTDRLGHSRVYYWRMDRGLTVCSEMAPLIGAPGFNPTIDEIAVAEHISLRNTMEDRTLFRDLRTLQAGEEIVWDESGARVNKYWDFEFVDSKPEGTLQDYAEEYCRILTGSLARRTRGKTVFALTAGMDARLLACCLRDAADTSAIPAFSCGGIERYDVKYGREIARTIGSPHTVVPIPRSFFADYIEKGLRRSGVPSIGHACWRVAADDYLDQHRGATLMVGLWGEILRLFKTEPKLDDTTDLETHYQYYLREHHEWRWMQFEELEYVLAPEMYQRVKGHPEKTLRKLYFEAPAEHPRHKLEYSSVASFWTRRYGRMNSDYFSTHCNMTVPFSDIEAVEFSLKIPLPMKKDSTLNNWIFENKFPEIAKIPRTLTLKPIAANPLTRAYHSAMGFAEHKLIPRLTGGRIRPVDKIHYVEYRNWLRDHCGKFVRDTVADSAWYDGYLNRDYVQKVCNDFLEGRSDDYGKIYSLVTLIQFRKIYGF